MHDATSCGVETYTNKQSPSGMYQLPGIDGARPIEAVGMQIEAAEQWLQAP